MGTHKLKVLFICTHNSARSQMAEGLMNEFLGHAYQAFSAGTEAGQIHPLAIRAMAEIGIDISGQKSKDLEVFKNKEFDFVVTVCDRSRKSCPHFPPGGKIIHKAFEDPASAAGSEQEKLAAFRKERDKIRAWVRKYFGKQVT
jgi:arsenate reductase